MNSAQALAHVRAYRAGVDSGAPSELSELRAIGELSEAMQVSISPEEQAELTAKLISSLPPGVDPLRGLEVAVSAVGPIADLIIGKLSREQLAPFATGMFALLDNLDQEAERLGEPDLVARTLDHTIRTLAVNESPPAAR